MYKYNGKKKKKRKPNTYFQITLRQITDVVDMLFIKQYHCSFNNMVLVPPDDSLETEDLNKIPLLCGLFLCFPHCPPPSWAKFWLPACLTEMCLLSQYEDQQHSKLYSL